MLLALLAALPLFASQDIDVPRQQGFITDLAGVISASEDRSLESLAESYKSGSKHEIAVLIIPSLEGQSLERYGLEVGRSWGLGQKDLHNGALLLVAVKEHKLRIEVGRGLEGGLTDIISGQIISDVIAPAFRSQGYYAGVLDGLRAMHSAIGGDYGPIQNSQAGRRSSQRRSSSIPRLIINLGFFLLIMFSMGRRRGGRGGMGGMLPWLILGSMGSGRRRGGGFGGGGGGGGFSGFGGGGGFSGGGASGGW